MSLGEFVAQYKQTVILMPNGPLKITGLPLEEGFLKSEYTVSNPESVVSVLLIVGFLFYLKATLLCVDHSVKVFLSPTNPTSLFQYHLNNYLLSR